MFQSPSVVTTVSPSVVMSGWLDSTYCVWLLVTHQIGCTCVPVASRASRNMTDRTMVSVRFVPVTEPVRFSDEHALFRCTKMQKFWVYTPTT